MRTLLLSAVLYLLGVALVLLFRPTLMFHKDGRWKEFGTVSHLHTVFPFWMFCILWAIMSYIITFLLVGEYKEVKVAAGVVSASASGALLQETEPPEDLVQPLPTKQRKNSTAPPANTGANTMKPGYYILDKRELKRSGVPKYIYIGDAPPDVDDVPVDTD